MKVIQDGYVDRTKEKRKRLEQTQEAIRKLLSIESCADGDPQVYEAAFSMELPKHQHLISKENGNG